MTFTEKLEHLMSKKGIKNRSQLSKMSGIPYTTIVGFFEKGTENIRRTTLIKLSDFFNCSLEYLVSDKIDDENYGQNSGFKINSSEIQYIQKYRALDEHGKRIIDFNLNEEYERCMSIGEQEGTESKIEINYSYIPASAGSGSFLADQNIELREYPDTPEARQADIVIPVDGDSMEPMFHDGDELYVRLQPAVEIGEIGIFEIGDKGYVKEYAADRLISLNPDYDDIYPDEFSETRCIGKVIGKVE